MSTLLAEMYLSSCNLSIDYGKDLCNWDLIGSGSFGEVRKATWVKAPGGSQVVAVKKLKRGAVRSKRADSKGHGEDIAAFTKELFVLSSLDHPHIVKLKGGCTTFPNLAMVMEYMEGG